MGIGRGKNVQGTGAGKKMAHHPQIAAPVAAPNCGGRGQTSHLLKIAPKAGMIYPFRKSLMKHPRPDVFMTAALGKALVC
jgi:hypothetical protein